MSINKNVKDSYVIYKKIQRGNLGKKKFIDLLKQYFYLVRKAAYDGNPEGQYLLGILYQDTEVMMNLKSNFNKSLAQKRAFYWYKKACMNDYPYACHNLAGFYGEGRIINKNAKKEMSLYLKSFRLGLNESGYALALLYKEQSNHKKTLVWLNKVLECEPNDGEAIFQLAKLHYEGKGIRKSYKRAYELFVKALATNYITEYTKEEILFYIAKMYFYGQYVSKSIPKSKYLLEQSNIDQDHDDIKLFLEGNIDFFKKVKKQKVEFSSSADIQQK